MLLKELPEGILLGLGNPLLDFHAEVPKDFLDKWGLNPNDAIICNKEQTKIFEELMASFSVEFVAGGATQNSLRVCQWLLKTPKRVAFFGAIGNDHFGRILTDKVTESGLHVRYQVNQEAVTGTNAALINGENRSLVAHLAAADTFTMDHFEDPENMKLLHQAQYYYSSGFFLTVCPAAVHHVARHAAEHKKVFVGNLAAPFVPLSYFGDLSVMLPYTDILFGNDSEAQAYAKAANWTETDVFTIAVKISLLPKVNTERERMVVITRGADSTIIAQNGQTREFPIRKIEREKIKDTNGCGDSFVGGFLTELMRGKSLEECVACGNYAAYVIIQQQGCTFPDSCDYH